MMREIVRVPAAEDMDDETFLKHLELRHKQDTKVEGYLHRHQVPEWIGLYRAFHNRVHEIAVPGQHDHKHSRSRAI